MAAGGLADLLTRDELLVRRAIDRGDPAFAGLLEALQGNLLKSHGRDNSVHAFLRFTGPSLRCRAWLRAFAPEVTSASAQAVQTRDHTANGARHPFVGLMLSASGYRALGVPVARQPADPAFQAGMRDLSAHYYDDPPSGRPFPNPLLDRLEDWDAGFRRQIDALVIIAYGGVDLAHEDARAFLDERVADLGTRLEGVGEIVHVEHGHVLRDQAGRPIEHFGFADGISNPLFLADDLAQARQQDGCERYDPSAPLSLILVPDPAAPDPHACGSYIVYRKLQQNIRGFHRRIDELAAALAAAGGGPVDRELAGAYVVGRFKDGTPVVDHARAAHGRPSGDFNYDHDPHATRCPLQAHTRKTNPRGDLVRVRGATPEAEGGRRIVRRAISYGPVDLDPDQEWTDAGLLFLALASDIGAQFLRQQSAWCNENGFIRERTGLDPVIGTAAAESPPCPQRWPLRWGQPPEAASLTFDFAGFVRCRGGEYLFAPSLAFLRSL